MLQSVLTEARIIGTVGIFFFLFCFYIPATETAQQLKKTAGVPFHAKGRGLVKKFDTTSVYMYL